MASGIYLFRCSTNGKVYIGQAADLEAREKEHRRKLRDGTHRNKHFQAAWWKHGEDRFVYGIIEYCTTEDLVEREQFWLDHYKAYDKKFGYNIAKDAGAFHRGCKHSDTTKLKMSLAHKGMKYSEEFRKKSRDRLNSPENREKIRKAKESPEYKAKMEEKRREREALRQVEKEHRIRLREERLRKEKQEREAKKQASKDKHQRRLDGSWTPEERAEWGAKIKMGQEKSAALMTPERLHQRKEQHRQKVMASILSRMTPDQIADRELRLAKNKEVREKRLARKEQKRLQKEAEIAYRNSEEFKLTKSYNYVLGAEKRRLQRLEKHKGDVKES